MNPRELLTHALNQRFDDNTRRPLLFVGSADGDTEVDRLAELRESLGAMMRSYGHALLGGAELAAILLPDTPSFDFTCVHLGVWGEAGWAWTQPKRRASTTNSEPLDGESVCS